MKSLQPSSCLANWMPPDRWHNGLTLSADCVNRPLGRANDLEGRLTDQKCRTCPVPIQGEFGGEEMNGAYSNGQHSPATN